MVVQLDDGKVHVISSIEDVRELIDFELYKAIVELTNNKYNTYESKLESEICELERDIDDLEDEVNYYSNSYENIKSTVMNVNIDLDRIIDYIRDNDNIDKDKLIKDLNNINELLEGCEDY